MKKATVLLIISLVLVMILSACGTEATETAQAPEGDTQAQAGGCTEVTTLKILAHQNRPMVEFMTKYNQDFMAKHPNVTVDMSVVNAKHN